MKEKTEFEILEQEIEKYIREEINWDACKNEVIKTAYKNNKAMGDVEQFAADSFFHGWQKAKEYLRQEIEGLLPERQELKQQSFSYSTVAQLNKGWYDGGINIINHIKEQMK